MNRERYLTGYRRNITRHLQDIRAEQETLRTARLSALAYAQDNPGYSFGTDVIDGGLAALADLENDLQARISQLEDAS